MNQSQRINPDDCRACGECCKTFKVFYQNGLPRNKYDEMIRILYCVGINATIDETDGGHWLTFHHPCKYLQQDREGKYSCELYDDPCRPLTCSLFPYPDTTRIDCQHIKEKVE